MGQYYLLANTSKREYIHPHRLGAPAKLWEIAFNPKVAGVLLAATAIPDSKDYSQGQEKPVLEFFHATNGEGKFKKLTLTVSQRGGVIIRLSEKEGDGVKSIVFSLNRTELITLSKEVELYLSGLVEGFADQKGRGYVVEFFHYSNNGQYKKLSVDIFRDGGLSLVLRQGEKGKPSDGIVFALSRGEAIHLTEELKLLFYKGV